MSQHNSFKSAAAGGTNRTVLKRFERVDLLKKREVWPKDRTRLTNLPKTKPEA